VCSSAPWFPWSSVLRQRHGDRSGERARADRAQRVALALQVRRARLQEELHAARQDRGRDADRRAVVRRGDRSVRPRVGGERVRRHDASLRTDDGDCRTGHERDRAGGGQNLEVQTRRGEAARGRDRNRVRVHGTVSPRRWRSHRERRTEGGATRTLGQSRDQDVQHGGEHDRNRHE